MNICIFPEFQCAGVSQRALSHLGQAFHDAGGLRDRVVTEGPRRAQRAVAGAARVAERLVDVRVHAERAVRLRGRMNIELNFPPNFERLVLGCIDADFCK